MLYKSVQDKGTAIPEISNIELIERAKSLVRPKKVAAMRMEGDDFYILSPCGRCREFMRQMDEGHLETEEILEVDKTVKLKELLLYHDWFQKVGD